MVLILTVRFATCPAHAVRRDRRPIWSNMPGSCHNNSSSLLSAGHPFGSQLPAFSIPFNTVMLPLKLGFKLWYCFEQIGNESVVSDLENRRLFVFVNRHNYLGVLHAGQMLNSSGNADC